MAHQVVCSFFFSSEDEIVPDARGELSFGNMVMPELYCTLLLLTFTACTTAVPYQRRIGLSLPVTVSPVDFVTEHS